MGRDAKKRADKEEGVRTEALNLTKQEIAGAPADLTEEEKRALYMARVGGLDEGYALTEDRMKRQMAATGSEAGYPEAELELSRIREREKAKGAAEVKAYLSEIPFQRRMARAGAYSGIYNTSSGVYSGLAHDADRSNTLGFVSSLLGAGAAGAGAYFGSRG